MCVLQVSRLPEINKPEAIFTGSPRLRAALFLCLEGAEALPRDQEFQRATFSPERLQSDTSSSGQC